MKVSKNGLGLCGVACTLAAIWYLASVSVALPVSLVSKGDETTLVGATGPSTNCTGLSICSPCTPVSGCTAMLGFGGNWYCSCTGAGQDGCAFAGAIFICSPEVDKNCVIGGGPLACGVFRHANVPASTLISGAWTCVPACATGAAVSPYCSDCL